MPRHARLMVPHTPHPMMRRGHNRQVIFAREADYASYVETLHTWKTPCGVQVYALCLLTNHVHVLLDPGQTPASLPQFVKRVAARHTR